MSAFVVDIADDAAASIARHWEGYLDETNSAAIDYIEENAGREGIELRPIGRDTRVADRIDGYDRDDLGESPDF